MIEEAEKAIEIIIQSSWNDTPVDWDNVTFVPTKGNSYIRVQIEWIDAFGAGPGRTRETGYVMVSFFVPVSDGTRFQAKLIGKMSKIFSQVRVSGMQFKPSRVQRVGENRGWFQRNLLIPFEYTYCKEN